MAKKASSKKKTEQSYEAIREKLETVVTSLERGEETLEDGLALYEEGVRLIRAAHGILDGAEKRLELLKPRPDGSFELEDGEEAVGSRGGKGAKKSRRGENQK